ncbi:MAG: helix-turn-helix domain-containing protein [Eubacteriales bacterium]|nr:helix-turn-helix domain-containing protein [Eubacteriales bacterium]
MVEIPAGQKGESMYTNFDDMPMMLSVPQAAEVLGISAVSLYKLIRNDNSFPVVIMGRRKSVPKEQLKAWIDSNCTR